MLLTSALLCNKDLMGAYNRFYPYSILLAWEHDDPNQCSRNPRMCDFTNLNLSPLCDVTAGDPAGEATLWGEAASATYHDLGLKPDYVENILGATRQFYINQDRMDRELLSGILEVRRENCLGFPYFLSRPDHSGIMHLRGTFPFSTSTSETPQ